MDDFKIKSLPTGLNRCAILTLQTIANGTWSTYKKEDINFRQVWKNFCISENMYSNKEAAAGGGSTEIVLAEPNPIYFLTKTEQQRKEKPASIFEELRCKEFKGVHGGLREPEPAGVHSDTSSDDSFVISSMKNTRVQDDTSEHATTAVPIFKVDCSEGRLALLTYNTDDRPNEHSSYEPTVGNQIPLLLRDSDDTLKTLLTHILSHSVRKQWSEDNNISNSSSNRRCKTPDPPLVVDISNFFPQDVHSQSLTATEAENSELIAMLLDFSPGKMTENNTQQDGTFVLTESDIYCHNTLIESTQADKILESLDHLNSSQHEEEHNFNDTQKDLVESVAAEVCVDQGFHTTVNDLNDLLHTTQLSTMVLYEQQLELSSDDEPELPEHTSDLASHTCTLSEKYRAQNLQSVSNTYEVNEEEQMCVEVLSESQHASIGVCGLADDTAKGMEVQYGAESCQQVNNAAVIKAECSDNDKVEDIAREVQATDLAAQATCDHEEVNDETLTEVVVIKDTTDVHIQHLHIQESSAGKADVPDEKGPTGRQMSTVVASSSYKTSSCTPNGSRHNRQYINVPLTSYLPHTNNNEPKYVLLPCNPAVQASQWQPAPNVQVIWPTSTMASPPRIPFFATPILCPMQTSQRWNSQYRPMTTVPKVQPMVRMCNPWITPILPPFQVMYKTAP